MNAILLYGHLLFIGGLGRLIVFQAWFAGCDSPALILSSPQSDANILLFYDCLFLRKVCNSSVTHFICKFTELFRDLGRMMTAESRFTYDQEIILENCE